jgi:tetratricopeptide (TPR) repeat protein
MKPEAMDQFSAHLDRGWDLVQKGDSLAAEQSARRALELDSQSPEAHNLLGYVSALKGEYEEALESYRQAIALDDTFLEAMLNAAELCIHPLGDLEQALTFCEDALELIENDDELVDTLLLQFDALAGLGRENDARTVCSRFPAGPFENPAHTFLVGRAFYEIGEIDRAEELLREAQKRDPENPDAPYYLALIRDERGDMRGAVDAFLRSRELDLALAPPPWSLTRETFELTARRVVENLVPKLRSFIRSDEVFAADLPGVEAIVDGVDPRALALIDALEGEGNVTGRLFVYQRNVERIAGAVERIEEEIRSAIEREIAAAMLEIDAAAPPKGTPLN